MLTLHRPIAAAIAGLCLVAAAPFADAALSHAVAAEDQDKDDKVEGAIAFTKSLTDAATTALTDENASEAEQLAAFQEVLSEGLALNYIGRIMLGDARKEMSAPQLERYNSLFPDYITRLYARQFADIVGRPLEILEAKAVRRDVIVRTQFTRQNASPILVDWRVRGLKSGGHKMTDIIVSGVSIMLVKREEFDAFIKANGVDALLDLLEKEAQGDAA